MLQYIITTYALYEKIFLDLLNFVLCFHVKQAVLSYITK